MPEIKSIRRTLEKYNQQHLLRFHDDLDQARQAALLEQLNRIDFAQIDELTKQFVLHKPEVIIGDNVEPPHIVSPKPSDSASQKEIDAARKHGRECIAAGEVAAFVVAGGQGTRLGYEGPKGCLEATPIAKISLFQVFAEQISAASLRSGKAIPWYVMTSPDNDVATKAFFRQHDFFGLSEGDIFFLRQGTTPVIGFDGKLMLAGKDQIATSPNGHGGSLQALRDSGALDDMARRGVKLISYFQVDNPLVRCIDPLFLGLHSRGGAQMSAKILPKRSPMEKLGNVCRIDNRTVVIEYSDMPEHLARATTEDGHLQFSAGSIAVHILSRSFIEELTKARGPALPYHRAEKKVPFVNDSGELVNPDKPNAVKLEMFIFDALPLADKTVILETNREEEFSPIKNASGSDSLSTSLHDQIRRSAGWLEQAGVSVPRDADGQIAAAIEISPLLADSAEELAEKIQPGLTITPGQNLYLAPSPATTT